MNYLKNTIIYVLSLCLLVFSTQFSALAESTIPVSDEENGSAGTQISVSATAVSRPVFTVSIPSGIPVGEIVRSDDTSIVSKDFNVVFSGVTYLNGKSINLTISAPNDLFLLYCGNATLEYELYKKNSTQTFQSGNVFATVTSDQTVTGTVKIDQADIRVPGEYAGQLTFSVSVSDSTEN